MILSAAYLIKSKFLKYKMSINCIVYTLKYDSRILTYRSVKLLFCKNNVFTQAQKSRLNSLSLKRVKIFLT